MTESVDKWRRKRKPRKKSIELTIGRQPRVFSLVGQKKAIDLIKFYTEGLTCKTKLKVKTLPIIAEKRKISLKK